MDSNAFLQFENLLETEKYKFDFLFAFKPYDPWKQVLGKAHRNEGKNSSRVPSGEDVKRLVLKSAALDHTVRGLLLESGESEEKLRKQAEGILDLMAHNQTFSVARIIAGAVYCLLKRTFNNVFVNANAFTQIKELFGKGPVVFLPSHRSYMDFLLVSIILYCYNMPIPVIAAAIDFLGMKFVGELLRRCGAFFIRRSFKSDKLYWTIFYEYVQTHLHASKFPLEFFIEGTRSRTGNFLYPKSGMLNVVCQDFLKGRVTDVFFVPVSISYERLLEESLYAFELATGLPKPKESTSGLLKARKVLDDNFGNIYVQFGQPFSLRQAAMGRVDRSVFSCVPLFEQFTSHESENFVQELSLYGIARIQENIYVQPWHLVASVLFNHAFLTQNRAVPGMFLVEKVNALSKMLKVVGCRQILTSYSLTDVVNAIACHLKTVRFCTFSKMFLLSPEELYFNKEGKTVPVIPVQLLMYQNMFINHLAPLFIAVKIIEKNNNLLSKSKFKSMWTIALGLFSQEFVAVEVDANLVLKFLESLNVISICSDKDSIVLNVDNESTNTLKQLSQPYFAVMLLTVFNLQACCESGSPFDKLADLNVYLRSKVTQAYDSGQLRGVCAVTTVAVNNVLNMCKLRGVVRQSTDSGSQAVLIDRKHCSLIVNHLMQCFSCDQYQSSSKCLIKAKL